MDCPEEDGAPGVPALDMDSSPVQESPFSNYLDSLSPIKSAIAPNVGQVFNGINTSLLVFASPNVRSQPRKDHLKWSGMFESGNVGFSHDVRKDDYADSSQKSRELVALSENSSDGVNKELSDTKDVLRAQSPCASQIADGFLAGRFEVDCANSTHSHGNWSKSASGFDYEGDSTKGFGSEDANLQDVLPKKATKMPRSCSHVMDRLLELKTIMRQSSVKRDVAKGDLSIVDGGDQAGIQPVSDIIEGSHIGAFSSHVQPPFEPFQDSEANENRGEGASESLRLLDDSKLHEVMQQQRFLLRRCLRFDDMLLNASSNSRGPPSNDVNGPSSLATKGPENLDLPEVTSTCIKTSVSTVKAVLTGCDGKLSAMTTNKPSGIGLHLNSIVGARSINSRETIRSQGGRGLKSIGSGTAKLLDKPIDFPHSANPCKFTKTQELFGTPPLDKRMLPLGFAEAEFAQSAKRRRKALNASPSDGCKRCSCKKSRCLKIYCDCFAAGLFCTEPCACQGCLNRFEEQDAVLCSM